MLRGTTQTFFIHSSFSFFFFSRKTAAQEQGPVWRFFFLNLGLMKQTE